MIDRPGNRPPRPTDAPPESRPLEYTLGAALFFLLAIYAKFPLLDVWISARYFQPGQGFVLASSPVLGALHTWTPRVGLALVALLLAWLAISPLLAWLLRQRAARLMGFGRRTAVLALLLALVGPGLLGEGLAKQTMGRPRPVQTELFGGTQPFQGPFQIGDNPTEHRSFFSTTAAAGFALMGLGLACGPVWRRRWWIIGLVTGSVLGMARVMQGAHFFSDVVFAFYAVWLSQLLLAWVADTWFPPRTH